MKLHIISCLIGLVALTSGAASSINSSMEAPLQTSGASFSVQAPLTATGISTVTKGLAPKPLRHSPRLTPKPWEETTCLLHEGFEGCQLLSDRLPEGWTRVTDNSHIQETEHWHAISRDYATQWYFPLPAEGDMMMVMFYDYFFKDESMITPTIHIPDADYQLSFAWYTVPIWMYMVDRFHVDFDTMEFTSREKVFDFEVMAREEGGEWVSLFDLYDMYLDTPYSELSQLDFLTLQEAEVSLADFAGKDIQIAFRYYGDNGNALFLDDIRVDYPRPDAFYMPHYSRLFYGLSAEDLLYMPTSIEYVPVGYPVTWTNESRPAEGVEYQWTYESLDEFGAFAEYTDDTQDRLDVTYRPDYVNPGGVMNNLYYLPELRARGPLGSVRRYSGQSPVLQAGGAPEFDFGTEDLGYVKFGAYTFDVINEGLTRYVQDDEELGFFEEPIFGYTPNHDAWWEHYSYPKGNTEGKYSYVDGFANFFLCHESAPMVVRGVTAAAVGTLYPEAELICRVYPVDEVGYIDETPLKEVKLLGKDVLEVPSGLTRPYLSLNFPFDEPMIFKASEHRMGYVVEISGYHDEKIEYFAPLQSKEPNEYEWCLGLYHHYWPYDIDLTNSMSYVAFFQDEYGRDFYSSFAIGLDAVYPWLEVEGGNSDVEIGAEGTAKATLLGYYDAEEYSIEAPAWLGVDLEGQYITEVSFTVTDPASEDRTAEVEIYAPGVKATFHVSAEASGITTVSTDAAPAAVYNLQGMKVRTTSPSELDSSLPKGIYITGGKKVVKK